MVTFVFDCRMRRNDKGAMSLSWSSSFSFWLWIIMVEAIIMKVPHIEAFELGTIRSHYPHFHRGGYDGNGHGRGKFRCAPLFFGLSSSSEDGSASKSKLNLPEIFIFNSATRQKELLVPQRPPLVSMYTCGPTVYDYAHVGNFRAFLTYDVLKRVLRYFGYDVDHVCNLTDVDDKIIRRCNELDVSLRDLTEKYEGHFMEDLEALNAVPARAYPRATEHVDEMVQLILDLKERGLAYQSEGGSWYFRVNADPGYGTRLIQLDADEMDLSDELENDGKENPRDFALWKARSDRPDATWETEIGTGRPGWHLECSAMARKFLGQTVDVHCGGVDLKFPHHENEIAQSVGANGATFCNSWVHNGFVNIGAADEKMSKSKGNFLTLKQACPSPDDVRAYRYLVTTSQYRNPLSFSPAAMNAAKKALQRIDRARTALQDYQSIDDVVQDDRVQSELDDFEAALRDDLSMPRASARLFAVVKMVESSLKSSEKDDADEVLLRSAAAAMKRMDSVFGLDYKIPSGYFPEWDGDEGDAAAIPEDVLELVERRVAAKDAKDFATADSLRDRIAELGYAVKDIKGGSPEVSRI